MEVPQCGWSTCLFTLVSSLYALDKWALLCLLLWATGLWSRSTLPRSMTWATLTTILTSAQSLKLIRSLKCKQGLLSAEGSKSSQEVSAMVSWVYLRTNLHSHHRSATLGWSHSLVFGPRPFETICIFVCLQKQRIYLSHWQYLLPQRRHHSRIRLDRVLAVSGLMWWDYNRQLNHSSLWSLGTHYTLLTSR